MKRHGFHRKATGENGIPSDKAAVDYIATHIVPKFARDGSVVTVTVPSILDHEIAALYPPPRWTARLQ